MKFAPDPFFGPGIWSLTAVVATRSLHHKTTLVQKIVEAFKYYFLLTDTGEGIWLEAPPVIFSVVSDTRTPTPEPSWVPRIPNSHPGFRLWHQRTTTCGLGRSNNSNISTGAADHCRDSLETRGKMVFWRNDPNDWCPFLMF